MEHCRLRLAWSVLVALSVLLAAAPLQAVTNAEEMMRFAYWTGCSPLRLRVVMDSEDAVRMGLTQEAVATTARSRLRAARLYTDPNNREAPVLIIHVGVVSSKKRTGGAFIVDVALHKLLYDTLSGLSKPARTNDITGLLYSRVGLHAGNAAFILSEIARAMDGFLDAYLRVNEPACPRSPIDP